MAIRGDFRRSENDVVEKIDVGRSSVQVRDNQLVLPIWKCTRAEAGNIAVKLPKGQDVVWRGVRINVFAVDCIPA